VKFSDLKILDRRAMLCAYQAGLQYARLYPLMALSLNVLEGYQRMTTIPGFAEAYVAYLQSQGGELVD
jgi:hypothetical protein